MTYTEYFSQFYHLSCEASQLSLQAITMNRLGEKLFSILGRYITKSQQALSSKTRSTIPWHQKYVPPSPPFLHQGMTCHDVPTPGHLCHDPVLVSLKSISFLCWLVSQLYNYRIRPEPSLIIRFAAAIKCVNSNHTWFISRVYLAIL